DEDCGGPGQGEKIVLGRERVDRGRNDLDPGVVETALSEWGAREDIRVGAGEVTAHEVPCPHRVLVRRVCPHVTPPDDGGAGAFHLGCEAGGLRVVKDDDVAWTNE